MASLNLTQEFRTIQRGDSFGSPNVKEVSLLSWNVLANRHLQHQALSGNPMYGHIPSSSEMLNWAIRSDLMINEMIESNVDIICIQECEDIAFKRDFVPRLDKVGYVGLFQEQSTSSQGDKFDIGVSTFWKRDKFILTGQSHRSRTMVTVLKQVESTESSAHLEVKEPCLAIVNCHLQGHPSLTTTRVKQLQNSLRETMNNHSHHALLVVGDFNCPLHDSACSGYLAFGSVPQHQTERGQPVPKDACEVPPHKYKQLKSASSTRFDAANFTFCTRPGHVSNGLDQIWYSSSLTLVALRSHFKTDQQKADILTLTGMPCRSNPSDHVPIAALFRWNDETPLVELRNAGEHSGSVETAEGVREQALSLLQACPISEQDRAAFEATLSPYQPSASTSTSSAASSEEVPSKTQRKGKPSDEELSYYRERRHRKEVLLSRVSVEAKQMLDAVMKLRRRADKLHLQRMKSEKNYGKMKPMHETTEAKNT